MEGISALILNVRKHVGNNVIVDCYTRERGRMAVIYGFTKNNKGHKALLSPMNWVSFSITKKTTSTLPRLRNLQMLYVYRSIGTQPVKNLMVLFLSEIIACTVREEHADENLFKLLEEAFIYFDGQDQDYENFHLSFLTTLTAQLGIAPPVNDKDSMVDQTFALWEAKMSVAEKNMFREIHLTPIHKSHLFHLSGSERSRQLNIMLDYLQTFATGFRMPKSLLLFRDF